MNRDGRVIPEERLEFIQSCVRRGHLLWTYHLNLRLKDRFIPRHMILDSIDTYDLIESYPEDKYLPSYLVLARWAGEVIHILFASDVVCDNVRVVTAYRPNPEEWRNDVKIRRKRP